MRKWEGIVLHHSATGDTDTVETVKIRRFHKEVRKWRDIAYNYVIEDIDGVYHALMGRPATIDGAHCPGKNKTHLSVCFVGNFDINEMPDEQREVGARLLASLCVMNKLSVDDISMHKNWKATACPGKFFPFDDIIYRTMIDMYPDGN